MTLTTSESSRRKTHAKDNNRVFRSSLGGRLHDKLKCRKNSKIVDGPPVRNVASPYDAAKSCIAKVPEVKSLRITVGEIGDTTGQANIAEGGTGTFHHPRCYRHVQLNTC